MFDYRSQAWKTLRLAALARARYRCAFCRANVRGKGRARVDHIATVREAPHLALTLSNLRVLCVDCDAARHAEKGARHVARITIGIDGFPETE